MKIKDLFKRKKKEKVEEVEKEQEEKSKVLYETESFRVRSSTKEEAEQLKKNSGDDIKIKYKDLELNMCGFTKVTNKDNKLVFGYKIKSQEGCILIHIPKDLTDEERENIEGIVKDLKSVAHKLGFEIMNSWDFVAKVYNEKHILEKVGEEIDNDEVKEK